jgi:hypothetical protein
VVDRMQFPIRIVSQDGEFILCGGQPASRSRSASVLPLAPSPRKPSVDALTKLEHKHSSTNELESGWAARTLPVTKGLGQAAVKLEGSSGEPCGRFRKGPMELASFLRSTAGSVVFAVCLSLAGCRTSSTGSTPTVVFNRVPDTSQVVHSQEVPDQTATIEGYATGVRPGERIVVYSKIDGRWGLQPPSGQPFTNIESDGRWRTSTLLGIEYAALLVDPTYNPPEQTESLPNVGTGVAVVSTVKGQGPAPVFPSPKMLSFSGYEWTTSTGPIFHAGSRNFFDPANVWVDKSGALHLRISGSSEKWSAAEVRLSRSLGYGTYRFQVEDTSHLEPSAVLTLITWDGVGTERNRRELDVELSRWGFTDNTNVHYVVQPYYVPVNFVRFREPPGVFTHSFRWEPGQVTFSTMTGLGDAAGDRLINQHVFTSGVPSPAGQTVRLSLYVFVRGRVPLKHENEVVIDKFEYLP